MSDLSPLIVPKQTLFSPGLAPQESPKKLGDLKRAFGHPNPSGRANHDQARVYPCLF